MVISACNRNRNEYDIELPLTPPLTRSAIGYGVISASYIHILETRGEGGASLGILRKGTIVKILERRPLVKGGIRETWLLASVPNALGENYSGWLRENELRIYESLAQAQTAAGKLLQ
jgi:hypothetical protein